jgi:hypothetical protein
LHPNGLAFEVNILPPKKFAKRGPERASERKRTGRSIDAHDQLGAMYCGVGAIMGNSWHTTPYGSTDCCAKVRQNTPPSEPNFIASLDFARPAKAISRSEG